MAWVGDFSKSEDAPSKSCVFQNRNAKLPKTVKTVNPCWAIVIQSKAVRVDILYISRIPGLSEGLVASTRHGVFFSQFPKKNTVYNNKHCPNHLIILLTHSVKKKKRIAWEHGRFFPTSEVLRTSSTLSFSFAQVAKMVGYAVLLGGFVPQQLYSWMCCFLF